MKRWNLLDGRTIHLVTPKEYQGLSDGAVLWDIFGMRFVKGRDQIHSEEVRDGHIGYGLLEDRDSSALVILSMERDVEIRGTRKIELEE